MPTLTPSPRRQIHLRRISCSGFAREDGLWEIEGRLTDTRPEVTEVPQKTIPAGDAIHDMLVCLTIDDDFVVRDAWSRTLSSPYRSCGEINASYAQLIGVRIEPGFVMTVKRMFRGVLGCSHLTELLPSMATTAFQVIWGQRGTNPETSPGGRSPLGGCHVLRLDGEVVRQYFKGGFVGSSATGEEHD